MMERNALAVFAGIANAWIRRLRGQNALKQRTVLMGNVLFGNSKRFLDAEVLNYNPVKQIQIALTVIAFLPKMVVPYAF